MVGGKAKPQTQMLPVSVPISLLNPVPVGFQLWATSPRASLSHFSKGCLKDNQKSLMSGGFNSLLQAIVSPPEVLGVYKTKNG